MLNGLIVSDPEIMSGTPCFKGTRVPLQNLLDYLLDDAALDEFVQNFPSVSRESARQVIQALADPVLNAHPAR